MSLTKSCRRQTFETLINEEALLLAKYLRNERCFTSCITSAREKMENVEEMMESGSVPLDAFREPLKEWVNFLSESLGIEPFTSPPRNITKLIALGRTADSSLFDIDVDYFQEMQDECYTPLLKAQPGDLGMTHQLVRIIHKIKPLVITISEAKVAAINNPYSNFSKFIARLERLGYETCYKTKFKDDKKPQRLIEIYQEFHETVMKPLQQKNRMDHDGLEKEGLQRHSSNEIDAIKKYFQRFKLTS